MTTPPPVTDLLTQARRLFAARDGACVALYRQVLAQDPDHAEALEALARISADIGAWDRAVALWARLAAARPTHVPTHLALADTRLKADDPAGAVAALRTVAALDPAHGPALRHLGLLSRQLGRPRDTVRWCARWHHREPASGEACRALTAALLATGRQQDAARALRAGLRHRPEDHDLWLNLGRVCRRLGRMIEAAEALTKAVAGDATSTEALFFLGQTHKDLGRKDAAVEAFERLLALAPEDTEGRLALASLLKEEGLCDRAVTVLAPLDPPPGLTRAGLLRTMARLPMVYRSPEEITASRAAYTRDLERLATPLPADATREDIARAARAVCTLQPYHLPYQNQNDRALQESFGQAMQAVMAAAYPAWTTPPDVTPPAPGEPVRVGLVSGHFQWHTIWKLFLRGWMTGLDPARVSLTAYATHPKVDNTTREARAGFPRFVDHQPFEAMAEAIRADRNHVLIWPEVGMDPGAARLACLRLAPVQCVSWGHPNTTGLPTMDWFLTSDLMEPAGEAARYSERVYRLPNLGIGYPPLDIPALPADFAALGIPDGAPLILCCQYLAKYLPQYDPLLARIAARVPGAKLAFIQSHMPALRAIMADRLTAAFAAEGLRAEDHVVFLPYLKPGAYAALNARADVYLDSIGWSGGNTTLEAVAAGLPVVTLPGPFMRGRHTAAILRHIGVPETIAADENEYVAIAARLGTDPVWRAAISARVAAGCPRITEDTAPLRALEDFLEAVARDRPPTVTPFEVSPRRPSCSQTPPSTSAGG